LQFLLLSVKFLPLIFKAPMLPQVTQPNSMEMDNMHHNGLKISPIALNSTPESVEVLIKITIHIQKVLLKTLMLPLDTQPNSTAMDNMPHNGLKISLTVSNSIPESVEESIKITTHTQKKVWHKPSMLLLDTQPNLMETASTHHNGLKISPTASNSIPELEEESIKITIHTQKVWLKETTESLTIT
jgi:hypothetical protein